MKPVDEVSVANAALPAPSANAATDIMGLLTSIQKMTNAATPSIDNKESEAAGQ